jgi:rod shape-determining protein MreC
MSRAPHAHLFVREMGLPARFGLYVLVCLLLLAMDARYFALSGVRAGINAVIHPTQMALAKPWEWLYGAGQFFVSHGKLAAENQRLKYQHELLAAGLSDRAAIKAENTQLRALMELPAREGFTMVPSEIIETSTDPFSRKIIINRGERHGIAAGWPVVDANGLVGQVTRVYPWSSEVSLLTDRSQGAPVQNMRNGLRIIIFGQGSDNRLEVRFLDMHADLQPGDLLYTSGIDGIYPAGVPVARVIKIEPPHHTPFARALCQPLGGVGRYRHIAVMKPDRSEAAVTRQLGPTSNKKSP